MNFYCITGTVALEQKLTKQSNMAVNQGCGHLIYKIWGWMIDSPNILCNKWDRYYKNIREIINNWQETTGTRGHQVNKLI